MKPFLDDDFLLSTDTAKLLYRAAAPMPIVDYHCHISPKEIWEDRRFENIYQVWLSGDHYKWRLMRSDGVDEYYITGDAPDREKFRKFASVLPKAIGNPMYHWCHLELRRYFGYQGILNADTADEVWHLAERKLKEDGMSVRGLIRQSNVSFIGTTDDPVDSLEWHGMLAQDETFSVTVAPSFRPDKALNIDKAGWRAYVQTLSEVSGVAIRDLSSMKEALLHRMKHFSVHGCKASDHGLDYAFFRTAPEEEADRILKKGLAGEPVNSDEAEILKTDLLLFCASQYSRLGWVMQIHYNCLRNPNSRAMSTLGPDTGFDVIGPENGCRALARLLDTLDRDNLLPRTVLYSLDGNDNAMLDALIGAFQGNGISGKLQHGSAWWFNDHKKGMQDQLTSLANLSILGNFIGMLTDSRSFLSYTRHEYFRRILCDLIGTWVENGEYPADAVTLEKIVRDICYNNAAEYFRLENK